MFRSRRLAGSALLVALGIVGTACSSSSEEATEKATASAAQGLVGSYVGCYTDDPNRALPAFLGGGHTADSCTDAAHRQGFRYAGLQWYGECWAGGQLGYSRVSDSECNTPCSANPSQRCGGGWRNSVYDTGVGQAGSLCGCTGGDMSCAQLCVSRRRVGCFADTIPRALPAYLGKMSPGDCFYTARRYGYLLAGLQYGSECWAGNSPGYARVDDGQCNMPCSGDPTMTCGGTWRNEIFTW